MKQYMIQRLAPQLRRLHKYLQVIQYFPLTREIVKGLRTQHLLQLTLGIGQPLRVRIQMFIHLFFYLSQQTTAPITDHRSPSIPPEPACHLHLDNAKKSFPEDARTHLGDTFGTVCKDNRYFHYFKAVFDGCEF